MIDLRTEILIDASLARCFDALVAFEDYGLWSPTHVHASRDGARLKLHLRASGLFGAKVVVSAKIRQEHPPTQLAWGGGLERLPWLLDIEHYFVLEPRQQKTHLVHGERFSGILGVLFAKFMGARLRERYTRFNLALRNLCEDA